MITKRDVSKPESTTNRAELCYEHASCFLNEEERNKAFEILLSLLDSNPESDITPERQVAKIINVSDMAVSKWKNKRTVPSSETSAKILSEIMKRDPNRINSSIAALSNKLVEEIFNTYVLLLDKEAFDRNLETRRLGRSLGDLTREYVFSLATLLMFDQELANLPSFLGYSDDGYPYNPEWRRKYMQRHLRDFQHSIDTLKTLVIKSQAKYNRYVNQA